MSHSDHLHWLNEILWPDADAGFDVAPGRTADLDRWWASPSPEEPHTLVPAAPAAAARRAARRYHDGQTLRRRARSATAEVLLGVVRRPAWLPLGGQVRLVGDPSAGVPGELRRILGRPDLTFAVTLAQPKSNRKPILQLLGADGACLGFAKVAADDHTARLIDNEAGWLARSPAAPLRMPALVFHGELAGRAVLVMSAVTPPRLPRRPLDQAPLQLVSPIADLGTRVRAPLAASVWWAGVEALLELADDAERAAVAEVAAAVGDLPLALGAWHGDFTPWNCFTTRRGVHVIDWEFAADGMPVGADVCHFHLQNGNETLGLSAGAALARAQPLAFRDLDRLGVDHGDIDRIWRLYLVELIRRRLALRRAGLPTDAITHAPAALGWLASPTPSEVQT